MAVHMVAEWRDDTFSEYKKLDAQSIYEELRSIGASNGSKFQDVGNQAFVDFARNNPESESHKIFNWNDAEAAEAYRREQAGNVKNHLVTFELKNPQVELNDNEEKKPIQLFINPGHPDLRHHAPTEIVMSEPELRKSALNKALAELNGIQKRYGYLVELAQVFDALSKVQVP